MKHTPTKMLVAQRNSHRVISQTWSRFNMSYINININTHRYKYTYTNFEHTFSIDAWVVQTYGLIYIYSEVRVTNNAMDRPLVDLAKANGFRTSQDHEWPENVDEDVMEFTKCNETRSIYVVEQPNGLLVGPPPRDYEENERVLVVAKGAGQLDPENWQESVVSASMPLKEPLSSLHTLLAQAVIPLFDSSISGGHNGAQVSSSSSNVRSRLVEAERALAQLMHYSQVAFVDLVSGSNATKAETALQAPPTDQASLNTLQQIFNTWKQQILQLSESEHNRNLTSASAEIGFWVALEAALRNAQQQTESPLFKQVWDKLEQSKRFQATHNFDGDTGLKSTLARVSTYNQVLFRDLQLGELLAASSMDQLNSSLEQVMSHLLRKLRASNYPALRSIALVEAIGRDFAATLLKISESQLERILDVQQINDTPVVPIEGIKRLCRDVIDAGENWDLQVRDFSTLVRDLIRKRAEKIAVVRVKPIHRPLIARMIAIDALCTKHQELLPLVGVKSHLSEVFEELVATPKLLQLSDQKWHQLESHYSREAHASEMAIAQQLRTKLLAAAHNESELLQVFEQHYLVLTRPQVRAVAHEFQTSLLNRARTDLVATSKRVGALGISAEDSGDEIEDIIGKVLKMQQLKLRIMEIRARLKIVLGSDWYEHSDGAQIDNECDNLERKLDPQPEVSRWADQIHAHTTDFNSPVFKPLPSGNLGVNGLYTQSGSHTQLRTLKALGFRFEYSTVQAAEQVADINTAVSRLVDAVATLQASRTLLDTYPRINSVTDVREHAQRIMSYVRMGLTTVHFNYEELYEFVTGFEHAVNLLDLRVTQLSRSDAAISEILENSLLLPIAEMVEKVNEVLAASVVGSSFVGSTEYAESVRHSLTDVVTKNISKKLEEWEPLPSEHRIDIRSQQVRITPDLTAALELWYESVNQVLKPAKDSGVLSRSIVDDGYSQALERICTAWNEANIHFNVWKQMQPLWEWNIEALQSEIETAHTDESDAKAYAVEKWSYYLREIVETRKQLISSATRNRILILDTTEARKQLEEKYAQWVSQLTTRLSKWTSKLSSDFMSQSRQVRREMEQTKLNMSSLLTGIQIFTKAKQLLSITSERTLPLLTESNCLLESCEFPVSTLSQWYTTEALQVEFDALQQISDQSQAELERAKPQILSELEQSTAMRVVDSQQFKHKWQANRPLQAQIEPNTALQILSGFDTSIDELRAKIKPLIECFVSLDISRPASLTRVEKEIKDWYEELQLLKSGWSDLSRSWLKLNTLGGQEFSKMDESQFFKQFQELQTTVTSTLPDTTKQLQNYNKLIAYIDNIAEKLPVMKLLKSSDAVQAHHLKQLIPRINEKPTVKDLWVDLPALETVQEVVEQAEGEYQLIRYIESVQEKWKNMILIGVRLSSAPNLADTFVLQNLDSVLTLVGDNLAAFHAMRASSHFKAVSLLVQDWENKLGAAKQLFDKFVDAQQQYLYLRGVLISPSVNSVLPVECRRFKSVEEEFTQLYRNSEGRPALEFASTLRIDANLNRIINQFASLHRSLSGFMETQRRRFPGLYFIGDDELLEIVGNPLSTWGFKHLPSLFQGVSQLIPIDTISGASTSTSSTTVSGEYRAVSSEGETLDVFLPKSSDNVEMLIYLEKQLKVSLKKLVFESIAELDTIWPDPSKFGLWIEKYPVQVALLAIRERWSRTEKTESHPQIIQWLSSAGDDSLIWMRRREVLVIELTHQLETPKSPLVVTANQTDEKEIVIKCGPCEMIYGYEFITIEPVVRTEVTDQLYLSAATAIAQNKGGSIIGPAGTGKTETVKALGAVFGKQVIVFNCDDAFDVNNVQRIMNGCTHTQRWACFDEFNRLSRRVLSSVAHTVSTCVKKTPIFVTMNPGYAGRTVLPPNMREEFREYVLTAPDAQKISRVLLNAHGKVSSNVADGVVQLLSVMSNGASKQKHYDWGLRALKGVLRVCRQLNGDMHRACEIAIRPRLMKQDLELFDTELDKIPYSSDSKSCNLETGETLDETKLDIDHSLVPYVKSLHTFIHLFAGVMLLGPAASGKSSVWKALARYHNSETVVIDPSAVSKTVLLGNQDSLTREWTDGLLSRLLRRVLNNLRGEKQKSWFVILRGEVEPQWAEALNSVLDDNRQLTLASGEILPLPSNVHLIFETTNLQAATPATVSRCGMICLHSHNSREYPSIPKELMMVAQDIPHSMGFMPIQAESTVQNLHLGNKFLSLAWALAGDSTNEGREKISSEIRQYALQSTGTQLPEGNLLTYYISDLTDQWHNWKDSVEVMKLERSDVLRPDIVVPTVDTAAHEALLQQALISHSPLLLVGPPGSGKTMTLFNALRQIPRMALIAMNFSSTASPELVIQALEMHCEYSESTDGSKVLSPSGSRWAALFIDEINLPQPNENGVVPVIQFLHMMVEHQGFFDSSGEFVKIERVQLVGACNPPPQRRLLPMSLLRHFITVNVDYPSEISLQTIYSTLMEPFDAQELVPHMLSVYGQLQSQEPSEVWTPRELTRWMRSIYTAYNDVAESQHSQKLLKELFVYEGCRVLADRLPTEKQLEVLQLLNVTIDPNNTNMTDSKIWSYYVSKRPKFVDIDVLRDFISARLPTFIEEAAGEGDKSLVIHNDFIRLVSRVDRILRQSQGHGLIVGPPSVGKTTAIRFVCWTAGLDLKILRIHSQYGDSEFAQDLRNVLLAALRRPICLVLSQELLQTPEFVERMNSLLANGEVPGLFPTEHQAELEEACRRAGFTPLSASTPGIAGATLDSLDMNQWFLQRVVSNLHIVFTTMSTEHVSPALLNRCTVVRVSHWSQSTKRQIAAQWCSTTDVESNMIEALTELPCNDEREFIELCYQFTRAFTSRKESLEETQRHFVSGGYRLKEAFLEVSQLKKHLATQQKRLEAEDSRSSAVLQQMLTEQSEAERKRAAAVEIRLAVQQQNREIQDRKKAANDDLAATEPLIEQASQGVQNIKKSQLNELRSLNNPPEPVKITLEAVCLLLGLKNDGGWRQVLGAVRGDEFIPRIVHFDTSQLMHPQNAHIVSRIEQEYMTLPSFTYERVDRASKAGGPLLRWVVAQVAYAQALAAVEPLMREIDRLNDESMESQAKLSAIEAMLQDLEGAIDKSKLEYGRAVAQCEVLKADMHNVKSQLTRAESLLASLDAEQHRWKHGSEQFPENVAKLPGDALVEGTFSALAGPLDIGEQRLLMTRLQEIGSASNVKLNITSLESPVTKNEIARKSRSVALVIDPSGTWEAESLVDSRDVKTTSFLLDADSLLKEVDTALRFGQHLVIKHAERFDPLLVPLLNREFVRKGARLLVNLGSGDIDVANGFKLTLHARDLASIERIQPLLLPKVSVVDFRMTASVFEKMIGDALLSTEEPELAAKRHELQKVSAGTQIKLRKLESDLLSTLSESAGALLENHQLVHSLETLKSESVELNEIQSSTTATLEQLDSAYATFAPTARLAANVYVNALAYSRVNPFYHIGVDWLWQIAESLLKSMADSADFPSAFSREVNNRIASVVASVDAPANSHELSLADVVRESNNRTPVIAGMTTTNAMDPTPELALHEPNLQVIAMGSKQAAIRALQMLDGAMEAGEWVVIQNTEIADEEWLKQLSRKVQNQSAHANFRIILVGLQSELVTIPDLVASGRPVSVERVRGIKANMEQNASVYEELKRDTQLAFVINWIHSCFTEAFPDSNFSKRDFESACWLIEHVAAELSREQLETILLATVWQAKASAESAKSKMKNFTVSSFDDEELPKSEFEKWIGKLPDDIKWLPKALFI